MPDHRLRIAEADWERLRRHCSPSFRGRQDTEHGAVGLLATRTMGGGKQEYLVTRILWPESSEVATDRHAPLTFASQYLRRAHLMVRKEGLAGIITFHTHPRSTDQVGFSCYDDQQDPELVENLQDLWPDTLLSSVVLGKELQKGRVWKSPTEVVAFSNLVAVGRRLQYLPLDGRPAAEAPKPSEIFDRAEQITGRGALARLANMTVAVVGASGTGSIICELLARAGCKHILLIDHDIVKWVNLNRILYAKPVDARRKRPKALVLKRAIEGLKLGCEITPIVGSVLDSAIMGRLNEADVIFGCVDKDFPRLLLSQYAYRHIIPYIDVGTEIGGDSEGIVLTDTRVSYVAPGRACLRCCGLVTQRRLRFESLTASERGREVALGYSDDLMLTQPAVMDLNMRAASAGTLLLRHLLQPFLLEPFPAMLTENMVTYTTRPIAEARRFDPDCDICKMNRNAGYGDCAEALGFPSEIAAALIADADSAKPAKSR